MAERTEKKRRKNLKECRDVEQIERVFLESDKIFGYRNVTKELRAQGVEISEYRVRRLMKANGFYSELAVKFRPIRNGKNDGRYCENKVKDDLIFHSDRGCQYSSKGYQQLLEENGITGSMRRAGCPYDHACIESFSASLKKEKIYRRKYGTMEEVKKIFSGISRCFIIERDNIPRWNT